MSRPTLNVVLHQLRIHYPDADIQAGERSEGFWIRCVALSGNWSWERFRLTSPGALQTFAQAALAEFYGN